MPFSSEDQLWADLGRRALACPDWAWRRGISLWDRGLVTGVLDDSLRVLMPDGSLHRWFFREPGEPETFGPLPYLGDPCTQGWLLELVRRSWRDPTFCARVVQDDDGLLWSVASAQRGHQGLDLGMHLSEVSLLVAALEVAPSLFLDSLNLPGDSDDS